VARTKYFSICPIFISGSDPSTPSLPIPVSDAVSLDDVSKIVEETDFGALTPLAYDSSEANILRRVKYAFVRHFECSDLETRAEYEKSADLFYRLYLGLKVLRPRAGRYQVFHYETVSARPWLPRMERNDYATIPCDCDSFNKLRWADLLELASIGPFLANASKIGRLPISQALQSLEIGYRADFLNVRHLLWVVGLDALFTATEWANQGASLAVDRITEFLGRDFPIYSEEWHPEFGLTTIKLNEVLSDVYKLRNRFAHGAWPNKQWAGRVCRRSVDLSRDIYYAEVLSETASVVLRGCLRKILQDK
jgi:hypothetical protein